MNDWEDVDLVPNREILSLIDTVRRDGDRILQLENHVGSLSNVVNSLIHDLKRTEKDLKAYMRLKNTVNSVIKKWEARIKEEPFK